jgi:Coenzyme PQQ synthesis protein D (PqqD)
MIKMQTKMTINWKEFYKTSDQVVTRKIEGELIIVPLNRGIGDLDAEMFSLNTTGAVIWDKLDGTRDLETVITEIAQEFSVSVAYIKKDVIKIVEQLLKAGFLIK